MNKNQKTQEGNKQNVIFIGGETAGPVMPLLALANYWKQENENINPIFLDRKRSVAARIVPKHGYEFKSIISGKLRRYWSVKNLFSPVLILWGIICSFYILITTKPIVVVGAGGYVQVPVIIAAWFLKIPRVIHQQDIIPTFSNKLVSPLANKITTTFEKSLKDFSQGSGFEKNYGKETKMFWTGNPSVVTEASKADALKLFKLSPDWPTVLVIGGGSGAMGLNLVVAHSLPELLKVAQVIHSTGRGKMIKPQLNSPELHDRYHQFEFIDHMDLAYAAADVVIARAGIGSITELSVLQKMSIIVPMPNSHQENNALYLFNRKAAVVMDQSDITPEALAIVIKKILFDAKLQKQLQKGIREIMPTDAAQKMLSVIKPLIK